MKKKTIAKISIIVVAAIVITIALRGLIRTHASNHNDSYARMIGKQFFDTILTSSTMQSVNILTMKIPSNPYGRIKTIVFWENGYGVKDAVLFVQGRSKSGNITDVPWQILTAPKGNGLGWLTVDGSALQSGATLNIGIFRKVYQPDGYFVGVKWGAQPRQHIKKFSGCLKVATGVPYAMQHNDGVAVTAMASPGKGFHGWCYHYVDVKKNWPHQEYYLHYFAASSAKSWQDVARWVNQAFLKVESERSIRAYDVAKALGLDSVDLSDQIKIRRIRQWMRDHLHYSGERTFAHIPQPFDVVLKNGFGDCKGLSLVMVQLLHQAGIDAHIVLTDYSYSRAFAETSANFRTLNHVAVHVPSTGQYFDPTVGTGKGLEGYQVMDASTGQIVIVPKGHD